MRGNLSWFLSGAAATGCVWALIAWRSGADISATPAAPSRDLAMTLDRIDRRLEVLESRMSAQTPPAAIASPGVSNTAPVVSATPEQQHSREAAGSIVQRAIGTGTWSRKDLTSFMVESAGIRSEDRFELMRQLAVAINEDRVKVEPGAEPR